MKKGRSTGKKKITRKYRRKKNIYIKSTRFRAALRATEVQKKNKKKEKNNRKKRRKKEKNKKDVPHQHSLFVYDCLSLTLVGL